MLIIKSYSDAKSALAKQNGNNKKCNDVTWEKSNQIKCSRED